jgi:hypothetical protein
VVKVVRKRFSSRRLACRSDSGEANVKLVGNLPSNSGDGRGFRSIW